MLAAASSTTTVGSQPFCGDLDGHELDPVGRGQRREVGPVAEVA